MQIRKLFDGLKRFGEKEYYACGDEEEIIFHSGTSAIEIFRVENSIDIVIKYCGERENYRDTSALTEQQKARIAAILQSYTSLVDKCNNICAILLEAFC